MAEVIEPGRSRIEDILLGEEDIEPGRSRIEDILLSLYQDLVHLNDQGLIPMEYIPPQVFERMVTVANDTERFALTTDDVQNGDWVYVNSTLIMYFVSDEDHLDTEAGYTPVAAGIAAKAVADKNGNQIDTTYQTIIDSDHKLSADNVDDTNATNKFATAAQLEQIETNKNNILLKQDKTWIRLKRVTTTSDTFELDLRGKSEFKIVLIHNIDIYEASAPVDLIVSGYKLIVSHINSATPSTDIGTFVYNFSAQGTDDFTATIPSTSYNLLIFAR